MRIIESHLVFVLLLLKISKSGLTSRVLCTILPQNSDLLLHRRRGRREKNGSGGEMSGSFSSSPSPPPSPPPLYMEHHVTKMDTLAGVAIRYGVEVADIKKMNGLNTDLQMFALKTLRIPLPGRHPPSPLSNGHSTAGPSSFEETPCHHLHSDLLESFQSLRLTPDRKLSPTRCTLMENYGLQGSRDPSQDSEVAVYGEVFTSYHEDETFSTPSSLINPLSQHQIFTSTSNGFKTKDHNVSNGVDKGNRTLDDKMNMRHQKAVVVYTSTPQKFLKEEDETRNWFSAITGNGLALRTKAASRTNLASEAETNCGDGFTFTIGESAVCETNLGVKISFSTPSLWNQDMNDGVSIWSTPNWSLKSDLQAALANPIFDSFPKPTTNRRAKAALD